MTWNLEGLKLMSRAFPSFLGFLGLSVGSRSFCSQLAYQEQDTWLCRLRITRLWIQPVPGGHLCRPDTIWVREPSPAGHLRTLQYCRS